MVVIEKIQRFIDDLEDKNFYLYLGLTLGVLLILVSGIIFYYYSARGGLQDRIEMIHEQRTKAKNILSTYEQVKKHKKEVDALMAENVDFKIMGYFDEVLTMLDLGTKRTTREEISHVTHENKYDEHILKAKLTDMNMKELCELLNVLEHNKRIYTKELEIIKSKHAKKAIDVTLTIATLEPRALSTI